MKKIVTFAMAAAVLAGAFTATTIATVDKAEAGVCVKIKTSRMVGVIESSSAMYEGYCEDLAAVEQNQYAKWIKSPRT